MVTSAAAGNGLMCGGVFLEVHKPGHSRRGHRVPLDRPLSRLPPRQDENETGGRPMICIVVTMRISRIEAVKVPMTEGIDGPSGSWQKP